MLTKVSWGAPTGSALGPILLIIYMLPQGHVTRKHSKHFYRYADDTQSCFSINHPDKSNELTQPQSCVAHIKSWMTHNLLLLNSDKSEVLLFFIILPKHLGQFLANDNGYYNGRAPVRLVIELCCGTTYQHPSRCQTPSLCLKVDLKPGFSPKPIARTAQALRGEIFRHPAFRVGGDSLLSPVQDSPTKFLNFLKGFWHPRLEAVPGSPWGGRQSNRQ